MKLVKYMRPLSEIGITVGVGLMILFRIVNALKYNYTSILVGYYELASLLVFGIFLNIRFYIWLFIDLKKFYSK